MADDKELEDNLPTGDMSGADGEAGEKKRGIKDDIKDEVEDRVKEKVKDEAKKKAQEEVKKRAAKKATEKATKEAGKKIAKEATKKVAEEGVKQAAIHGTTAAAGGAAAGGAAVGGTVAGVATGPVGWIVLAVTVVLTIIAAILKWIKDHPYETIAAVVLILVIAMLPVIIPVAVILAFLQALWAFISNILGFIDDAAMKAIDSISFGLVSYEKMDTMRDVNKYMKLIGIPEEVYEERAEQISELKSKKANLETLKGYMDAKEELENKKDEETDPDEIKKLDEQIANYETNITQFKETLKEGYLKTSGEIYTQIEKLKSELEEETDEESKDSLEERIERLETRGATFSDEDISYIDNADSEDLEEKIEDLEDEIGDLEGDYADDAVDDESSTRDMMLDMYDMTKDYFDELYANDHYEFFDGGLAMCIPSNLQDENDTNTSNWINLSQADKSKYLATNVFGVSEEILDNLYMGKMFTNEQKTTPYVASTLEPGKTYYYGTAEEFKYNGSEIILRDSLSTYYDILGSRSIDYVAFNGLKDYYSWSGEISFNKRYSANAKWKNLTAEQRDNEIKRLLRTRLTAYVGAENQFWASNGDADVELSDVGGTLAAAGAGAAAGSALGGPAGTVIGALGASAKGIGEIINKAISDNDNIKVEGYRAIESEGFKAILAFARKDNERNWNIWPLACANVGIGLDVEIEGPIDWICEKLGWDSDNLGDSIFSGLSSTFNMSDKILFSKTLFRLAFSWHGGIEVGEELVKYTARYSEEPVWTANGNSPRNAYIVYDENNEPVDWYAEYASETSKKKEIKHDHDGKKVKCEVTITLSKKRFPSNTDSTLKQTAIGAFANKCEHGYFVNEDIAKESVATDFADWDQDLTKNDITKEAGSQEIKINKEVILPIEYKGEPIYVVDELVDATDDNDVTSVGFNMNGFEISSFKGQDEFDENYSRGLGNKQGIWIGLVARAGFMDNGVNTEVEKTLYNIFRDGENTELKDNEKSSKWYTKIQNWAEGNEWQTDEELIGWLSDNNVDVGDINSVNEAMKDTLFKLIDERELVKSYGIPSAFSYFVPLEESTRNIPFLIALAQEMKNTRVILSPLQSNEGKMVNETLTYVIDTKSGLGSLDLEGDFACKYEASTGRFQLKLFGGKLIDIYPQNLKKIAVSSVAMPVRDVVYANLWDREVINQYEKVITPKNINLFTLDDGTHYKTIGYVLANQYVVYKDKPYELITKYNVSQADVGIYEEVTGRPFMNQYTYDKITKIADEKTQKEWLGSLDINDMYRPVESRDREAVGNGQDGVITGYEYKGSGNVSAVEDGELIAIEELKLNDGSKYSSYIILYHEEDKTFSMYSNISFGVQKENGKVVGIKVGEDENEKVIKIGDKVNQGDAIGTYNGTMYFEYRQGGGDFKNFWTATPVQVDLGKTLNEIEVKEKESIPDDDAEPEIGNEPSGGGSGGAAGGPSMGGNHSNKVNAQQAQ